MLYLYDKAIISDLNECLGKDTVRVIDPEAVVDIVAQIENDDISFPVIALTRSPSPTVDISRTNFTWMHSGVSMVIDPETNNVYNEKILPIKLAYNLTVLTTNQADLDEIVRELLFKYIQMYFLTIKLPYESDRKIRFGIRIDPDTEIEQTSGSAEYIKSGALYQAIIPIQCDGCVLVTYTPAHLQRLQHEIDTSIPPKGNT